MTSFGYIIPCPFTLLHLLPTKSYSQKEDPNIASKCDWDFMMECLMKLQDEAAGSLFIYPQYIWKLFLNQLNPFNFRETVLTHPPALNAANCKHFAKWIILPTCGTV